MRSSKKTDRISSSAELGEYEFVEKQLDRMGEKGRPYYKYCYYMMIVTTLFAFHRVSDELREQVAVRLREVMTGLFERPGFDQELLDDGLKPQLFDIPVRSIDDVTPGGSTLCIIAVKNNDGIEKKLRKLGFVDIIYYMDMI